MPPDKKHLSLRFILHNDTIDRIVGYVRRDSQATIQHLMRDPISESVLREDCDRIANLIENAVVYDLDLTRTLGEIKEIGQKLYNTLVGPTLDNYLARECIVSLQLILEESLLFIPWEILYDGKEFLAEKYNIGRIVLSKEVHVLPSRRQTSRPLTMLILADPDNNLPGAAKEGVDLKDFAHTFRSDLFAEKPAEHITEQFIEERIWNYDIVHYAGHAHYKKGGSLTLHQGKHLTAQDVITLKTPHKRAPLLIFANACQAGKTQRWTSQDIVYDLTKAFLLLGVQFYIGTLWKITDDDESPVEFAIEVYKKLAQGKNFGEAIRLARKKLRDSYGITSLTWLSYVFYGDPTYTVFDRPVLSATAPETILERGINLENELQLDEALKLYQLFESQLDRQKHAPLYNDMYFRIASVLEKLHNFNEALSYLERIPLEARRPDILNLFALVYYRKRDYEMAEVYCQNSREMIKENDPFHYKGEYLHYLALIRQKQRRFREAYSFFEQARTVYDDNGHATGLARVSDSLGSMLMEQGNIEAALAWYMKSKFIKQQLRDDHGLAITYGNLGRLNLVLERWQKAIIFFERDRTLAKKLGDRNAEYLMLNHMGQTYIGLGDLEKARECYKNALDGYNKLNQPLGEAFAKLGLAEISLRNQDLTEATSLANECLLFFQSHQRREQIALTQYVLSKINLSSGDLDDAEKLFEQSINSYKNLALPTEAAKFSFEFGCLINHRHKERTGAQYIKAAYEIARSRQMNWLTELFDTLLSNKPDTLDN